MHQKIEINSFLVTKLKAEHNSFTKYDIEASIDEVENEEGHIKLKYRFVLLSNPTNVKLSVDGHATVYGNQQDLSRHLSNDENNIPVIVNTVYQEIFPFLYITAKTMQIPSPAYRLSEISKSRQPEVSLEQTEEKEEHETEYPKSVDNTREIGESGDMDVIEPNPLMPEQNISTL